MLSKATFVPVSINRASAAACAGDPLAAAMATRRMTRASTAMVVRKQRLYAMRSRKDSQPGPPSVRNDQLKCP
jgi:hypothetical protein